MDIKHVFFDLDHTLWDFETNSNKTFDLIFRKNNVNIDFNDFKKNYNPINEKYWKLYRNDQVTKSELRYNRLKDTFSLLNFPVNDELINLLSEEYIQFLSHHNALFPGAIDVLEYLKPKYKLHIITNGFEEVQIEKINNSSLSSFFNNIITSEKVGFKKPNPKIFQYALDLTKARSQDSIMIGDNFEADILGAKNIGMHTIFCDFIGVNSLKNGLTVTSLIQIKQLL